MKDIAIYRKTRYFFRRYDMIYQQRKLYIDIFDILNHHYCADRLSVVFLSVAGQELGLRTFGWLAEQLC